MSTIELQLHSLHKVEIERTGEGYLDIVLFNHKNESVLISLYAPRDKKDRGAFNALANCLDAEFNPGENDDRKASTSSDNTSTDDIPF